MDGVPQTVTATCGLMTDMFRVLGRSLAAMVIIPMVSMAGCSGDENLVSQSVSTAGTATKDVFLRGTVRRDGKPVSRARIDVFVEDELEAAEAKVGDTLESFTAATAVTDDHGTYTLRLKADELPSKYFSPGGRNFLNFSIDVVSGKTLAIWSSTMYPEGQPAVWRTSAEATAADAVMRANFDLGTEKLTTIDSLDQKETGDLLVMRGPGNLR